MIHKEKCIVLDVDGTLCPTKRPDQDYADLIPHPEMLALIRTYKQRGFHILLYSARNMNRFDGNLGQIVAHTGKALLAWLDAHNVPYDELHLGKPWPGDGGFYVDDKAIRPSEFLSLSYDDIQALLKREADGQPS